MSKKRRGQQRRSTRPTPPQGWDDKLNQLRVQLQILESMYQRLVAANQAMQAQMEMAIRLAIGMHIAVSNGEDDFLVSRDQIARIGEFVGIVPTEDDEGNLVIELVPAPTGEEE